MGATAKRAAGVLVHTVLLTAMVAVLLVWGGREVSFTGTPDRDLDRDVAMSQWAQASIDEQLLELGCDKTQRLTEQVAVRNAAKDKAGRIQFDTTVVKRVSFDAAWAMAQRGEVYVVGWCGA